MEPAPESLPTAAGMYDFYLGGRDNSAVDRAAAQQVLDKLPDLRDVALANRGFLLRAVRYMAGAGIRQFLDLGSGLPTSPNVHEVARQTHPDARVVYVDKDQAVTDRHRTLLTGTSGVGTVLRDLREPDTVLADPVLRGVLDLDQPVGMLCIAVMHFVEHEQSLGVLARYRSALAPGSYLGLSVICRAEESAGQLDTLSAIYQNSSSPLVPRSAAEAAELFDGFALIDPGLVDVTEWRADASPGAFRGLCGVGRRG